MRVLLEDTCFAPKNDWIRLAGIQWLGVEPRDLWIRVKYSSADDHTVWACATHDEAAASPQPLTFLASASGLASENPISRFLLMPDGTELCAVQGVFHVADDGFGGWLDPLPDALWAYIADPVGSVILEKAAQILQSYAYPGAALGGIQPRDITTGPGADSVSSLPAVHIEAQAPIDSIDLHPGVLANYRFQISVRTPGPVPSAWRAAIEYSRAIVSILADEHRRDVPAGILCRYVGGDGPVPDGPSEGGRKCVVTFEVVGIEAVQEG